MVPLVPLVNGIIELADAIVVVDIVMVIDISSEVVMVSVVVASLVIGAEVVIISELVIEVDSGAEEVGDGQKPAMKAFILSRSDCSGHASLTAESSWAGRSGFEQRQSVSMPWQPDAARTEGRPFNAQSGRSLTPAGRP